MSRILLSLNKQIYDHKQISLRSDISTFVMEHQYVKKGHDLLEEIKIPSIVTMQHMQNDNLIFSI